MKQHAQAILQFTGYPLEPIVALQINKSYQSQALTLSGNVLPVQPVYNNVVLAADVKQRWLKH